MPIWLYIDANRVRGGELSDKIRSPGLLFALEDGGNIRANLTNFNSREKFFSYQVTVKYEKLR